MDKEEKLRSLISYISPEGRKSILFELLVKVAFKQKSRWSGEGEEPYPSYEDLRPVARAAEIVGVSDTAYRNYLQGDNIPGVLVIERALKYLPQQVQFQFVLMDLAKEVRLLRELFPELGIVQEQGWWKAATSYDELARDGEDMKLQTFDFSCRYREQERISKVAEVKEFLGDGDWEHYEERLKKWCKLPRIRSSLILDRLKLGFILNDLKRRTPLNLAKWPFVDRQYWEKFWAKAKEKWEEDDGELCSKLKDRWKEKEKIKAKLLELAERTGKSPKELLSEFLEGEDIQM